MIRHFLVCRQIWRSFLGSSNSHLPSAVISSASEDGIVTLVVAAMCSELSCSAGSYSSDAEENSLGCAVARCARVIKSQARRAGTPRRSSEIRTLAGQASCHRPRRRIEASVGDPCTMTRSPQMASGLTMRLRTMLASRRVNSLRRCYDEPDDVVYRMRGSVLRT